MKKAYYVQVNDYMTQAKVMLTENEAKVVAYVLEEVAKKDKDALVEIKDEDYGKILYSNYDEWIETHK